MKCIRLIILVISICILATSCKNSLNKGEIEKKVQTLSMNISDIREIKTTVKGDSLIFNVKVKSEMPHELWSILLHKYLIFVIYENLQHNEDVVVQTSVFFNSSDKGIVNVADNFNSIKADNAEYHQHKAIMVFVPRILQYWDATTLYKIDLLLKKLYDESGVSIENRYESMAELLLQIAHDCNNKGHSNERTILGVEIETLENHNMLEEAQKFIFFYDYCSDIKWKDREK